MFVMQFIRSSVSGEFGVWSFKLGISLLFIYSSHFTQFIILHYSLLTINFLPPLPPPQLHILIPGRFIILITQQDIIIFRKRIFNLAKIEL